MYHIYLPLAKNAADVGGIYAKTILLLAFLLCALALLISDTAAGLASGLARGLALTATAVLCACTKVLCLKSCNTLHIYILHRTNIFVYYITQKSQCQSTERKKTGCIQFFS